MSPRSSTQAPCNPPPYRRRGKSPHAAEDRQRPPSKSHKKRVCQQLAELGTQLTQLDEKQLQKLPLSPTLCEAVSEFKRIKGSAKARQKRYVGKLLSTVELAALLAALQTLNAAFYSALSKTQPLLQVIAQEAQPVE